MSIKFEVRQQVVEGKHKRLVAVYDTTVEELAVAEFERRRAAHPGQYFEVVRIETREECLHYTPFVGG